MSVADTAHMSSTQATVTEMSAREPPLDTRAAAGVLTVADPGPTASDFGPGSDSSQFLLALSPSLVLGGGTVADVVRPKVYVEPRVSTAVRLPSSLHQRLRREARARQVSANLLVERALQDYLDHLPSAEVAVRAVR